MINYAAKVYRTLCGGNPPEMDFEPMWPDRCRQVSETVGRSAGKKCYEDKCTVTDDHPVHHAAGNHFGADQDKRR
jgi:hypothetical protein